MPPCPSGGAESVIVPNSFLLHTLHVPVVSVALERYSNHFALLPAAMEDELSSRALDLFELILEILKNLAGLKGHSDVGDGCVPSGSTDGHDGGRDPVSRYQRKFR